MRIKINQLNTHLKNGKDNTLLPVYFISSDEPLQLNEACDSIRKAAHQLGYDEREIFHVDASFDWSNLQSSANELSLFSEKRLIELRIPNGKPGDKGSKALVEYISNPPIDTILLIISGKIESQSQRSKWFTHLDKAGLVCQIWPIEPKQMPQWITQRMHAKGLTPTQDAAALLSDRVEGNLLAAAQEIEKLSLLYGDAGKKNIDIEEVIDSVSDNARFSVFELADAALDSDAARVTRILQALRSEGVEAVLVLWALSREIRELCIMGAEIEKGTSIEAVLTKYRVWEKRKPYFRKSLQQRRAAFWQQLLVRSGHLDRVIKGRETGNKWDELLQLGLLMAGIKLFTRQATTV